MNRVVNLGEWVAGLIVFDYNICCWSRNATLVDYPDADIVFEQ